MFLTLVENSFKHGISKSMKSSWIKIAIQASHEWITFHITNSKRDPNKDGKNEGSGGIGLKNLENRLKLMYKDQFTLKIEEHAASFDVMLQLKTVQES